MSWFTLKTSRSLALYVLPQSVFNPHPDLLHRYGLQIRFMDYVCLIDTKSVERLFKEHPISKYSLDVENGPAIKVDGKYIKLKRGQM